MTTRPRVILADDYAPLLTALGRMLADECEIVGRVSTVAELVESSDELRPDIAIVDMSLPDANGIEACRRLASRHPAMKVIILTAQDDAAIRAAALDAGAVDYIHKAAAHSRLLVSVRKIWERGKPRD